jgi:DNA polymerase-3 subunit delta'
LRIPRLQETDIEQYLVQQMGAPKNVAESIARISEGSIVQASALYKAGNADYFELFTNWMRLCYNSRKELEKINLWVEKSASEGREFIKSYLSYCQHMIRACFIYKFGQQDLLRLNDAEKSFVEKFSAALTQENMPYIVKALNETTMHVERNADLKITLLNLSLFIGRLLHRERPA